MIQDQIITYVSSLTIMQITLLAVFILVVKGMALWDSAIKRKKAWFIALLILNTLGILPLIYLICFKKKR